MCICRLAKELAEVKRRNEEIQAELDGLKSGEKHDLDAAAQVQYYIYLYLYLMALFLLCRRVLFVIYICVCDFLVMVVFL